MSNELDTSCGHHCGTENGMTRHCPCCHAFAWHEADGCGQGIDENGNEWFDLAETHDGDQHDYCPRCNRPRDPRNCNGSC